MTGRWRPGASWHAKGGMCTIVQVGTGPADEQGRRDDDELVATAKTPEIADRIVAAVNATAGLCLDEAPPASGWPAIRCQLPSGHEGAHKGGFGVWDIPAREHVASAAARLDVARPDEIGEILTRLGWIHVGWLGPHGLIPGGMDNDPVPGWRPVYAPPPTPP